MLSRGIDSVIARTKTGHLVPLDAFAHWSHYQRTLGACLPALRPHRTPGACLPACITPSLRSRRLPARMPAWCAHCAPGACLHACMHSLSVLSTAAWVLHTRRHQALQLLCVLCGGGPPQHPRPECPLACSTSPQRPLARSTSPQRPLARSTSQQRSSQGRHT